MKQILILALLTAQSLLVASPSNTSLNNHLIAQNPSAVSPSGLILDLVIQGHHLATWDVIAGSGNYMVGIVNLTTNQTHSVFSTPNNSAVISGLVSGNTYKFTIVKNGYIIIDIIDIG
ncbi:MAG: hypothetical protein ACKVU2_13155 [Saprospiraceae bacterium]